MTDIPVVELRQYTLHSGQREALIELFEREFVESQEAVGIRVLGQFRDLDRPDRFVWLRGFPDMRSRAASLQAFYGGAVWKAHRAKANVTMKNSDDVLLLRPVHPGSGFSLPAVRPSGGAHRTPTVLIAATVYLLRVPVGHDFTRLFESRAMPVLRRAGALPIALYQTEPAENTFPALPVRTGENAFVSFSAFDSLEQYEEHRQELRRSPTWTGTLADLSNYLTTAPQPIKLKPTAQSLLGYPAIPMARSDGAEPPAP
jgi:quinol monooxygenase YgiN